MRTRSAYALAMFIGIDLLAILLLACIHGHFPEIWHGPDAFTTAVAPFALSLALGLVAAWGLRLAGWEFGDDSPPSRFAVAATGAVYAAGATAAMLALVGIAGHLMHSVAWPGSRSSDESVTLLAVNDIYRIEGVENGRRGGLARLRTLRAELESRHPGRVLLLHAGDVIFPSLLSRMFKGQQMIDALNLLDGDGGAGHFDDRMLVAFGNHEFEKEGTCDSAGTAPLQSRVTESDFNWISTNIRFTPCPDGKLTLFGANMVSSQLLALGSMRVGVFGLTLESGHPSYVFDDPVATAKSATDDLRARGADVVIALTHLNIKDDVEIHAKLGAQGPDLIIGGHDHDHMAEPKDDPHIFKADADAVSAWVIELTKSHGKVAISAHLRQLDEGVARDPAVAARVDAWLRKHEFRFCLEAGEASTTCLSEPLAVTTTPLRASETAIRGSETSVGNWTTDLMLDPFKKCGASAALINSGTLRLNQDIPAGAKLTRRHLEELVEYPTRLVPIKIREDALWKAMENSVAREGSGGWLQVSGIQMRYDRSAPVGNRLTRLGMGQIGGPTVSLTKSGTREFTIVVSEFMLRGKDDGYNAILQDVRIACPGAPTDLKGMLRAALAPPAAASGLVQIAPREEGRICEVHDMSSACGPSAPMGGHS